MQAPSEEVMDVWNAWRTGGGASGPHHGPEAPEARAWHSPCDRGPRHVREPIRATAGNTSCGVGRQGGAGRGTAQQRVRGISALGRGLFVLACGLASCYVPAAAWCGEDSESGGPAGQVTAAATVSTPAGSAALTAGDGSDFTKLYRTGLESCSLQLGWGRQHNLPTGPRTGMKGDDLQLRYSRFVSPRHEVAAEFGLGRIDAAATTTHAVGAVAAYRWYVTVKPRRTLFWELALGLTHLEDLVPEQSTHTNFAEHVGIGMQWPVGSHASWGIQYRFQHVSNAGRRAPNIGINASGMLLGYTHYF